MKHGTGTKRETTMDQRTNLLRRLSAAQDEIATQDIITIVYCSPVMTDAQLEAHVVRYEQRISARATRRGAWPRADDNHGCRLNCDCETEVR